MRPAWIRTAASHEGRGLRSPKAAGVIHPSPAPAFTATRVADIAAQIRALRRGAPWAPSITMEKLMPHIRRLRTGAGARLSAACRLGFIAIALGSLMHSAMAQEEQIRKALSTRLPQTVVIDEVTPSPIPGLYEVRSGMSIFYTDANGDYVIRGDMLDTRRQTNLSQARLAKLSVVDFSKLPLQDAIVSKRGQGTRKLAVFADPDCPYCKQLESMLEQREDITVYTFLLPVLGPASLDKAKAIWCSRDRDAAWRAWMQKSQAPTAQTDCDTSALERNLALGGKHAIKAARPLPYNWRDSWRNTGWRLPIGTKPRPEGRKLMR
jgi:thiol:disulfide interchange protein DsbC